MARFYNHEIFGTADSFATGAERVNDTLHMGWPDDECPTPAAPIGFWHMASVTEFGAPLAGELVEAEGK